MSLQDEAVAASVPAQPQAHTARVDTTVVVPTFNEGGNVAELVSQIGSVFGGVDVEVLFVDDSTDDTPAVIAGVADTSALRVNLIHRTGEDRKDGLAGAVSRGLAAAQGDYVIVMDGDLQHPPAMCPTLRDAAAHTDLVVASRYCGDGDAGGLSSGARRAVSSSSTLLTRMLFPKRVGRKCTDPMTGFFCIRREAVRLNALQPRGFKILLELLVSHPELTVAEEPFVFGERLSGESKAGWRNGVHFLIQLLSLRIPRAVRFLIVGAIGLVVNLAVMAVMLNFGIHYVLASIIGTEVAIGSNFLLQETFVFHDLRSGSHAWGARAWRSVLYNNVDNLVRIPLLILLVSHWGISSLWAQLITLMVAFVARFFYTSRVVYRPSPAHARSVSAKVTV